MLKLITSILEQRVFRFALTGLLATLIHIIVAFLSIGFFYTSTFAANLLGFSCAFGMSYWLQSNFVFQKTISWHNAKRFFIVQFMALLVAQIISKILSSYSPYYRVLFVVFLIPLITYFIHHIWTYNENDG